MEIISQSTLAARTEKWNKVAKIFTYISEPLLAAFCLVCIILAFSPLQIDASDSMHHTLRVGFCISYNNATRGYSFGGLNLFGIIGGVVALILSILVYYFNFFKSDNSLLNRYSYIANGVMLCSTIISLLVGEFATIDGGNTFVFYKSEVTNPTRWDMNGLGYGFMGVDIVLILATFSLWMVWATYQYQYHKINVLRKKVNLKNKRQATLIAKKNAKEAKKNQKKDSGLSGDKPIVS